MKKSIFWILAASPLCVFAGSQTWGEAAAWVYKPVYSDHEIHKETYMAVFDNYGNETAIKYVNGIVDRESLDAAIKDLRLTVSSVFSSMAYLAQDIIGLDADLNKMDQQLEDLNEKLNSVFADIFKKMSEINVSKSSPSGGGSVTETYRIQRVTEQQIILQGGVAAANVDDKSIDTTGSGEKMKYQIKGFNNASTGRMPFKVGTGLDWTYPIATWFDNAYGNDATSIGVSYDPSTGMPSNKNGRHGVHIAGWYDPASGVHQCTDKLSDLLSAQGEETHYVLTKYIGSGPGSGALHYTPVGTLSNLVGNASIRFVGTDGSSGGPANAKTTVTFASASDSNVGVAIGGSNTNITITIGVYWKD